MLFDVYTLPYLVINAGQESMFMFGVFDDEGNAVQNAKYTCAITEYCNGGGPLVSMSGNIEYDSASATSTINLALTSSNTMSLSGKYVYQITITTQDNHPASVRKGILFVRSNTLAV